MKFLVFAAASLSLAGCVTPQQVADHEKITLRDAVFDVARTLHEVRDEYRHREKIGLGVSKATVVFNISAKATDQNQLKIETAAAESLGFPLSGMFQRTLTTEGLRGNTITIEFTPGRDPVMFQKVAGNGASGSTVTRTMLSQPSSGLGLPAGR